MNSKFMFCRILIRAVFGFAAVLVLAASVARGQNLTVDWSTCSGSSATAAGGVYTLSGTAGQIAAGSSSASSFALIGGFWAADAPSAVAVPALGATRVGRSLVFSWPASGGSYTLQSKPDVSPTTAWTTVAQTPVLAGDHYTVSVPMNKSAEFFRLVRSP